MWAQPALAAVLPGAVVCCIQHQSHASVRIMLRHLVTPWANKCPPQLYSHWLMPSLRVLLPHMYERLSAGWSQLLVATGGAPSLVSMPVAAGESGSGGGAAADATTNEVLADTLLREASTLTWSFFPIHVVRKEGNSAVYSVADTAPLLLPSQATREHLVLLNALVLARGTLPSRSTSPSVVGTIPSENVVGDWTVCLFGLGKRRGK